MGQAVGVHWLQCWWPFPWQSRQLARGAGSWWFLSCGRVPGCHCLGCSLPGERQQGCPLLRHPAAEQGHPVHCLAACKGGQGERLCDRGPCACLPAGRAPAAGLPCHPTGQVTAALLPELAGERPGPSVARVNSGEHPRHARATC